jgi:nitrous oxidase accessory protein NosD
MSTVRLQKEMSYREAVQVLGFKEGDWISPHLPSFRRAEEKLRELIAGAENEELQASYREELARLNEAVRVVDAEKSRERAPSRRRATSMLVLSLLVIGGLLGAAWMGNQWIGGEQEAAVGRQVESLLATGRVAVENRRWPEAAETFNTVLALRPESTRGKDGLRSIVEGKEEERRQAIGFLLGTAQAAMEARNWDGAEQACHEVRTMDPDNSRIGELEEKIRDGRVRDKVMRIIEAAEEAIREEQWEVLAQNATELENLAPGHVDLPRIQELTAEGMKRLEDRRNRARELYVKSLALDDGSYSEEALEMLREAMRLQSRPEYQGLYQKISSHARTLRVPEEFDTIGKALAAARGQDKVRIGEGKFEESLVIPATIDLEGAGPGKTIIEIPCTEASVVKVGQEASGSRLSGFTLRHSGVSLAKERFPVVAVTGAKVTIEDCWVENGSGHGVAVIEGSSAVLRSVRVSKCGWDGLSVYGAGSRAEVIEGRLTQNLQHGIDAWDGGGVMATRTRCSENGLAGVVLMSTGVSSKLEGCTSDLNRELGILVANGSHAVLNENQFLSNLLGGVLVRDEGTRASLSRNRIMKNAEAGVVVDRKSTLDLFEDNESRDNSGEQVQLKADLKKKP